MIPPVQPPENWPRPSWPSNLRHALLGCALGLSVLFYVIANSAPDDVSVPPDPVLLNQQALKQFGTYMCRTHGGYVGPTEYVDDSTYRFACAWGWFESPLVKLIPKESHD